MGKPAVPIEVDDDTGVWSVDGLPMILIPRHFFVNYHRAMEQGIGRERYAAFLFDAGYRSAWTWCEKEAATHGLAGAAVFHHYMKRLSQRGWARFAVQALDPQAGTGRVRVDHSVFVLAHEGAPAKVCHMFRGWYCGALEYVRDRAGLTGRLEASETQCAADGAAHCVFAIEPAQVS